MLTEPGRRSARYGALIDSTAPRAAAIADALRRVERRLSFGYAVPAALLAVWASCGPNFHLDHPIDDDDGLDSLVYWWLTDGRNRYPGIRPILDDTLARWLHTDHLARTGAAGDPPITPLLQLLLRHKPELAASRDFSRPDGVRALWAWWRAEGEFAMLGEAPWSPPAAAADQGTTPGIGIVGYPRGEFGLGEDIRHLRTSLRSTGIEPSVTRAPWRITARQGVDEPATEAADTTFARDVMFYCLPAFDTLTLLHKVGVQAFTSRRRIGFWQWELERFPDQAKAAINLVDEIWCHSEHSARAFRSATDKPVIKVPLPVSVPDVTSAPRARFGLPDDAFVVFTSFDGSSMIARKNPLAAIQAFQDACPRKTTNARFVLKAMNTKRDSLWRECLRRAAMDDRVVILDRVIDRPAYYELLKSADAVISLHRAEGFGRLMADAMAMGIPTIASAYSGNLDFMNAGNSWLVEGRFVPLFEGDYAFFEGQHWFEANRDAAAAALRECMANPAARKLRAEAGRQTIQSGYSPEICGLKYRELLAGSVTMT
jgi:glycosyltransferase involved in cell wall biosynthesis